MKKMIWMSVEATLIFMTRDIIRLLIFLTLLSHQTLMSRKERKGDQKNNSSVSS